MTGFRANWTENPCKLNRKRSGGKKCCTKMGAAHCKAGKSCKIMTKKPAGEHRPSLGNL